jgi:RNA recognition motif-containing protein
MNLFVARLNSSTTGEDLQEIFSQYGEVSSSKVIFDRETGNSKGFGFVEMPNAEEANAAIAALNETEVDGKEIVVKEANDRPERPRRDFQKRDNYQSRGGGGGYQRRDDRRGGGGGGRRNDNRSRGSGGGGYDSGNSW